MKVRRRIRIFTEKHPLLGPLVWMFSVQYFVAQLIVASVWPRPYSWLDHTISALGNTSCSQQAGEYICSPLYWFMNTSFVLLGMTMVGGSLLIYDGFGQRRELLAGFLLMTAAGFGATIVGLFPENTIPWLHYLGAGMAFLLAGISLMLLAARLHVPRALKFYTLLSAVVSLGALVLFVNEKYMGLGVGGMERLVSYPQTIWLIVFGVYISRTRVKRRTRRARTRSI